MKKAVTALVIFCLLASLSGCGRRPDTGQDDLPALDPSQTEGLSKEDAGQGEPTVPSPDTGTDAGTGPVSGIEPTPGTDPNPGTQPPPNSEPGLGTDPTPGADPGPGTQPPPNSEPGPGTDPTPGADPGPGTQPPPNSEPGLGTNPPPGADPGPGTQPPPNSEPGEPCPDGAVITLTFVGDVLISSSLDELKKGNFKDYAETHEPSYFLEKVQDYFANDDFTIVNLETPLTDLELEPRDKGAGTVYWFKGPAKNVDILTAGSVECVSTANNHIRDYGNEGILDTLENLKNAGLSYGTQDQTLYIEKYGFTIAVICSGLWNTEQAPTIRNRILGASEKSDYQIVFFHGGQENVHQPEEWKVDAARSLVDAGADLVLGGHPHVLQPREIYNGVEIVYSLGNFCYGGSWYPENRTILYQMRLTLSPDGELTGQQSDMIPCYVYTGGINNFQPAVIEDENEKQLVLDFMNGEVEAPL